MTIAEPTAPVRRGKGKAVPKPDPKPAKAPTKAKGKAAPKAAPTPPPALPAPEKPAPAAAKVKAKGKPKATGTAVAVVAKPAPTKAHMALEATDLLHALLSVRRIVPAASSIPQLQFVRVYAADGKAYVSGQDLDHMLTVKVPAAGSGTLFLPLKALVDFIGREPGQIALETHEKGVEVRLGRRTSIMEPCSRDDWPAMTFGKETVAGFSLDSETLGWALERCADSMSTEATRYYLNGVSAAVDDFGNGKELRFVATDGHTLVRAGLPEAKPVGKAGFQSLKVIFSRLTVLTLIKLCYAFDHEAPVRVDALFDGKIVMFTCDAWRFHAKLVDGEFPDYQRAVPAADKYVTHAAIDSKSLLDAAIRASKMSKTGTLKLSVGRDSLDIEAKGEGADAFESVAAEVQGKQITIGLDPRLLESGLRTCDERAVISIIDASSPIQIVDPEQADLFFIQMPKRI